MKRFNNLFLPVLFAGMFAYAGCAKQEVVKSGEPVVPVAVTTPVQPPASAEVKPSPSSGVEPKKSTKINVPPVTADLQKALEKIYFSFDSSTLNDAARQVLVTDSAVLKRNPTVKIRVEGHCDERGSDAYNLALGERRAQAAVRYLTDLGVAADRLSTISYGEEKPADPGHNEAAWAKNRRDELVIIK